MNGPSTHLVSAMGSQNQYYADGRLQYAQDLRNGNFDRGYSYDHAGRTSEATSGREARGETPSSPVDSPYKQTLSHNVWNNLSRTGRLWSEGQSDAPTYTNNRRSDRAYDAEGHVVGGGWQPFRTHDYDAGGKQVNVYEESWSGPSENQVFHQNTIAQTYDGDGQPGKRVETRHSEDANNNVTNDVRTAYSLRSSVLGGVVIAEIDSSGQREGHVYVGGEKIADYNGWAPYGWMDFRHANPANGNWVSVQTGSNTGRRTEFDPLGATVGTFDPFPSQRSYNDMVGNDWLYQELGNPFDLGNGCPSLDGMPIKCAELDEKKASGLVAEEYPGHGFIQRPIEPLGLGIVVIKDRPILEGYWIGGFDNVGDDFVEYPQETSLQRWYRIHKSCVDDFLGGLSNNRIPSSTATSEIMTAASQEGADETLIAVTWTSESEFSLAPGSNGNAKDKKGVIHEDWIKEGNADIGPMQINYNTWHSWPGLDGLSNVFGTTTTGYKPFDGDVSANVRAGARILKDLNSRYDRAGAAGRYRTGER